MDDMLQPTEAISCLPSAGLEEIPADFVPLRLLLQPGGLCIELGRPIMLVGRHSTADVRLCLPDISRRHCRFVFEAGRWEIHDLSSLNGVYVNGQRLREATLSHGDTLRIASVNFLVDIPSESRAGDEAREDVLHSIAPRLRLRKAS